MSVWNAFRAEYSYVDYRRWGAVETWSGCRINEAMPTRQRAGDRIEVWFNWELVGEHTSYASAERQVAEHMRLCPVSLGELAAYLKLRP